MIYCPKCGTANRDGSRFCNECGQTLGGPTRVRCARCGAMNSVQSAFCSECGGQLLSPSGEGPGTEAGPSIKGLSLPTKEPGGQVEPPIPEQESGGPEEDVPAWLRELGAAPAPGGEPDTGLQGEDLVDIPDWLQDLRASFPAEDEAAAPPPAEEQDVPDWLARLRPITEGQQPADLAGSEEVEEENVPDWLAELRPLVKEEASEPAPSEEKDEVPAWLAELHSTAGTGAAEPLLPEQEADKVPDWLAELQSTVGTGATEPTPPEGAPDEEDVPDWLAALPPRASTEMVPASTPEDDEELPSWLSEVRPARPDQTPESQEGIPAWLAALGPATAAAKAESEEEEAEEIPSWLAEQGAVTAAEPKPEPEEEIPAWLAALALATAAAKAEAEEEIPSRPAEHGAVTAAEPEPERQEEIPAWLAELEPGTPDQGPEPQEKIPAWLAELEPDTPDEEAGPEEAIPAWLAELGPAGTPEASEADQDRGEQAEDEAGAEDTSPAPWPPELDEGEIPEWIAAMRPKPAETEAGVPPGAEGAQPEGEERPEWLVAVPSGEEASPPEEVTTAAMPDWLQTLPPGSAEEETGPAMGQEAGGELPAWLVPAAGGPDQESLARAEIPAWLLALRPAELRDQGEPDDSAALVVEAAEETGLLAGLRGTLPVEMLIAQPRAVAAAEAPLTAARDAAPAGLFAQIVGRGPDAAPKAMPQARQSRLGRVPLWITYLALLAAVTVPLLLQDPLFARSIAPPASVLDLYGSVEALAPDRPVLVAFEYDPSSSDEMNVLAETVVGHVFSRGIPVVAVSLQPAGPPVAQAVLEELAARHPGARYASAGFVSGQAAGVQLLGQGLEPALLQDLQGVAPADPEVAPGVTGLDSFALLLVLAAEPESLRIWIEQAGALQDANLAAAVSASLEPVARSYYATDPRQLQGLVAGVPGAATYESLLRGDGTVSAETAAGLDSLAAGHAVFILVLVVGNIAYLVRRDPRGRR